MFKLKMLAVLVFLALAVGATLPGTNRVQAVPPTNDDFNTPLVIQELPFLYGMDISEATYAADDPLPTCYDTVDSEHPEGTVWFAYTPSEDSQLWVSGEWTDYAWNLSVYTGERGALTEIACANFEDISFPAQADTTYYVMVGAYPGDGTYPSPPGSPWRSLRISMSNSTSPPDNDQFVAAMVVSSLPFSHMLDNRFASVEIGEPTPSCIADYPEPGHTVWYAFTPAASGAYESKIDSNHWNYQAVYQGDSLNNLSEIRCDEKNMVIQLEAGQTYYIQVGSYFGSGGVLLYDLTEFVGPPNDDFDGASVISSLPYTDTLNTEAATSAPDDPTDCTNNGSVWYAYTPQSDMMISADTFGSDYDTVLSVYTGSRGSLQLVPGTCVDDVGGMQSQVFFQASAGTTYYFMIGKCCGYGGSGGGNLVFHVQESFPPPNDMFANAIQITGLPFTDTQNNTLATLESGEPFPSCIDPYYYYPDKTIWYRIIPNETIDVMVSYSGLSNTFLGVYRGETLGSLVEVGCSESNTAIFLHLEAGYTYSFQLGSWWGDQGLLIFNLDYAAPPSPDFTFSPPDPSIYDLITFTNLTNPIASDCAWDFGDGETAQGCTATHQYKADGDYSVTQTVSGPGGEPLSTTQVVPVRTHDLAVAHLKTPKSARVGQTKMIIVGVVNQFYPEMARIKLYKSSLQGFTLVSELVQVIPAQTGKRTVNLVFRYTFTEEDANIGKVLFRADIEPLLESEDFICDNQLISQPVKMVK